MQVGGAWCLGTGAGAELTGLTGNSLHGASVGRDLAGGKGEKASRGLPGMTRGCDCRPTVGGIRPRRPQKSLFMFMSDKARPHAAGEYGPNGRPSLCNRDDRRFARTNHHFRQ